jgi:hypothetical protein
LSFSSSSSVNPFFIFGLGGPSLAPPSVALETFVLAVAASSGGSAVPDIGTSRTAMSRAERAPNDRRRAARV